MLGVRRHDGIKAERGIFQQLAVGFDVFAQLDAEVVEREFVQGHALAKVFEVEDFLAKPEKLFVAVTEVLVDEVFDFVRL